MEVRGSDIFLKKGELSGDDGAKKKSECFSPGKCFAIGEARKQDVVYGIEVTPVESNETLSTDPATSVEICSSNSWSLSSQSFLNPLSFDQDYLTKPAEPLFLNPPTLKSSSSDSAGSPVYGRKNRKRQNIIDGICRDLVFIGNIFLDEGEDEEKQTTVEKESIKEESIQCPEMIPCLVDGVESHLCASQLFSDMFEQSFSSLSKASMAGTSDERLRRSWKGTKARATELFSAEQLSELLCRGLGVSYGTMKPEPLESSTMPMIELEKGAEKIRLLLDTLALKHILPKLLVRKGSRSIFSKELLGKIQNLRANLVDLKRIEEEDEAVEDGVIDESIVSSTSHFLQSFDRLTAAMEEPSLVENVGNVEKNISSSSVDSISSPASSQDSGSTLFNDRDLNAILKATENEQDLGDLFPSLSTDTFYTNETDDDDGLEAELGALTNVEEDIRKELETTEAIMNCIVPSTSDQFSKGDAVFHVVTSQTDECETLASDSSVSGNDGDRMPYIRRVHFASKDDEFFYKENGSSSQDSEDDASERRGDLFGAWEEFLRGCDDLIDELALACVRTLATGRDQVRPSKGKVIRRSAVHF